VKLYFVLPRIFVHVCFVKLEYIHFLFQ